MQTSFMTSRTRENLMRAFAGESQARNRYTFAQQAAFEQNMYALSEIFRFTAMQEEQHAKIFYELLEESTGKNVDITAGYPVNVFGNDILRHLEAAVNNENEEHIGIYPEFARIAKEEGFTKAASKFALIAEIEKAHGERFAHFAGLMRENKLYSSDKQESWICLNCGHIHTASEAPVQCPVCSAAQGYFIRHEEAPYTWGGEEK